MNEGLTTTSSPDMPARLVKLEQTIEAGLQTFRDVGAALLEIRDDKLYKPAFPSFEAYCIAKWKLSRAHAYRMIGAATVSTEMSPIGDIANETHARALAKVTKANRAAVLKKATEKAAAEGRPLAARHIAEVAQPAVTTVIVTPPPVSTGDELRVLWLKATQAERDSFLFWTETASTVAVATEAMEVKIETPLFACNNCGEEFIDDEEAVPLYECGACAIQFTTNTSANGRHQCPECSKFGFKVSDCGCPSCDEGELGRISEEPNI